MGKNRFSGQVKRKGKYASKAEKKEALAARKKKRAEHIREQRKAAFELKTKRLHEEQTSNDEKSAEGDNDGSFKPASPKKVPTGPGGLSVLQAKFKQKLEGARFRIINERLYTCKGSEAFKEFTHDPALFDTYHQGFREQVTSWPANPLTDVVSYIKEHEKNSIIADMGCGDAELADALPTHKVHSFDLVAKNDRVTACDMAHVPLEKESVDVVVFCLALMGCNIQDFIMEAHRILKLKGVCYISEVRSRFDLSGKKASKAKHISIPKFEEFLKKAGFDVKKRKIKDNKMFFTLILKKTARTPEEGIKFQALPCTYKKR